MIKPNVYGHRFADGEEQARICSFGSVSRAILWLEISLRIGRKAAGRSRSNLKPEGVSGHPSLRR